MRLSIADQERNANSKRNIKYFFGLGLLWLLSPYLGILAAVFLTLKIELSRNSIKAICFFISMSFALLAYTQKSLYWDGTDITRYYYEYAPLTKYDFSVAPLFIGSELLTYTFTPINILLVLLTKNVQYISLFWTLFIYYFSFLSILNFIEIYYDSQIKNRRFMFSMFIFIIFGAILFTQVTETIKSAAAISFFWYVFTRYLKRGWNLSVVLLIFFCAGLHAQTLMLLPMFFFRSFKYKYLFIIAVAIIAFSTQINLIHVVFSFLPSNGWTDLLIERAANYGLDNGDSSSKRYIFEGLLCFLVSLFLYSQKRYNDSNKIGNLILLYVIIMFLNYNNSNAFIRFANFISFIATIEFIALYTDIKIRQLSYIFLGIFLVLNYQMTSGRTLSGGYCSSYMDNSIVKILFSNIYDYITFKAYNS